MKGTNHAVTRFAIIAYLPIVKLRDIFPEEAAEFAVAGLLLLAAPLLAGRNYKLDYRLKWWWWLPILLAFQLAAALIFFRAPINPLLGNAVTMAGAVLACVVMYKKRFPLTLMLETVLAASAALLIASTAFYVLGIHSAHEWSQHTGYSSLLREFGYRVPRSGMPLTGGGVRHSTLSAVVLAGALIQLFRGRQVKFISLVAIPCALWGLAVGDGRAALAGAVLGFAYAMLRGVGLRWAALSVPVGFTFLSVVAALLPYSWALRLSRSGEVGEIAAGNGRAQIWQAGLDYLADNPFAAIAGMGQFGQITSGVTRGLGRFSGFDDAQLSMHSVGMQALIDGGVIGLGLTTLWLFYVCKGLERFPVAAAMMLAMLFAGVFDVWMTHYSDEGFFVLMTLGMIGLTQAYAVPSRRARHYRRLA